MYPLILILSTFITHDAYAYLDPGTGSFIIQVVIGAIAGSLFFIKQYWQKIKTFLNKNKKE